MRPHTPRIQLLLGRFLIVVLALNGFCGLIPGLTQEALAQQKDRVIIVNADQPNVWTLEQAHYLLAQLHRRNLDLRAKGLDPLDANEIAGLNFDVMRQLFELTANFNQADLVNNRTALQQQNFNSERRQLLISRRDQREADSLSLARDISGLETEKARATSQEKKDQLDAEISAKKAESAVVDKQIESIDNELKTLNPASTQLTATQAQGGFDASKLPKSDFDDAFKDAAKSQIEKFNQNPKINASLQLEKFLQLQYEIIAKQLTLLRDEVGPGERLLFLELPQTINVAYKEADNKWAQSWWKIVGYTTRGRPEKGAPYTITEDQTTATGEYNQKPITTADDYNSVVQNRGSMTVQRNAEKSAPRENSSRQVEDVTYTNKFVNLDAYQSPDNLPPELAEYVRENKSQVSNRLVRTVDLIPRQSSLNVNDMKLRVKAGAVTAVASFLFGFGTRLNVQRQREQFSQFVQQELYSSAFGKGAREFGWTFTPMPGTNRLLPGVRTTYAVVIVPEAATQLVLESNGCYFPRAAYQPNNFEDTQDSKRWGDSRTSRGCGQNKLFVVPIPNGGADGFNDFWVKGISYRPVEKGNRIVVAISGQNFSSQIGVLVNGFPLSQSIGLAQPLIRDDSTTGREVLKELNGKKVRGEIERVDANKIVFSFEAEDVVGTPTITLVAPNKAININWLENVAINGKYPATLNEEVDKPCVDKNVPPNCIWRADWMFGVRPTLPRFKIAGVEVFRTGSDTMKALIHGAGLKPAPADAALYINGVRRSFNAVSPTLIEVSDFPVPSEDAVQVTLVYGDDTIQAPAIPNPGRTIKVDKVTTISFEEADGDKPAVLVVRLDGTGFPNKLDSSEPTRIKVAVTSPTEAFMTIINPGATEIVTLTDPFSRLSVTTIIPRQPPPQ